MTDRAKDREAIQIANAEAFGDFMKAVLDGVLGNGSSDSITDASSLYYRTRDMADRILEGMDDKGIGLHRHGVSGRVRLMAVSKPR